MNKTIWIASAATLGATALFYYLMRKRNVDNETRQLVKQPSRHLTNVFSKAKLGQQDF